MERVKTPCSLRFIDYLKSLPSDWVLEHFFEKSDAGRKILSSSMIERAAGEFCSRKSLQERFLELDSDLRLKCATIYLCGGQGMVAESAQRISGDPLIESFLVFVAKDEGARIRYFGFDQFEHSLRPVLARTFFEESKGPKNLHPETFPFWRPVSDTTIVAGLAFQRELQKSRTGGFSRKALNQLKNLTHDSTLSGRSRAQDPVAAGFLTGFCVIRNFLIETESEYTLNTECFNQWLKKNPQEQYAEIVEYAIILSGCLRLDLLKEILHNCDGHWISTSAFPESQRTSFIERLKVFESVGLITIRRSHHEIQFSPVQHFGEHGIDEAEGEHNSPIVIMPDFSTILSQEIPPAELFECLKICQLESFDKVYRGKIARGVIANALNQGVDGITIRDWYVKRGAPDNIITTIQEWVREFSRLYMSSDSIVVSSDERVTFQIASFEPLRKHLEPVSAHAVFRINPGSEQKVQEILSNLGFDPRMPSEQTPTVSCEGQLPKSLTDLRDTWSAVVEFAEEAEQESVPMKGTKYGTDLKALEMSELSHVIDYAILTGLRVRIDYEGSPYIKEGIYTILPLSIQKGIEPMIEAEVPRTRTKKQFYLKKILRIGVMYK